MRNFDWGRKWLVDFNARKTQLVSLKTASKKIGTLIYSMKLLSCEVALYLFKSIIQPCMENTVVIYELILLLLGIVG